VQLEGYQAFARRRTTGYAEGDEDQAPAGMDIR